MYEPVAQERAEQPRAAAGDQEQSKPLTIGGVCRRLRPEFPDISISKIRYLEDQGLIAPHRTPGGYRLYSPTDVGRLKAILRTQRDRFLPLREIRRELDSGRIEIEEQACADDGQPASGEFTRDEILRGTGADVKLLRELEEYGIVRATVRDRESYYDDSDRRLIAAAAQLARFGVAGRNLRLLRSSAEKEAALLEQILAPSLKSGNRKRRSEALETLESLAEAATSLHRLILSGYLRRIAGKSS